MPPIIEMLDGRIMDFVGLDQGFSLPTPRSFRGRVGAAIPTAGIVLPSARGGKAPVVYATSNLPSGLSFNVSTRAISGAPTVAHNSRAVVFSATDSSSPAETVSATFEFPIVSSNAAISRLGFDFRGYGLSTRSVYLLALLESTTNVAGSNVVVWRRPPQTGAQVGTLLDDEGTALTDLSDMTITAGGQSVLVDQIQFQVSSDRIEFSESTNVHFGNFVGTTLGAPTLFMRIGADENEIDYDRGFSSVAQWRRSSPDLGAFLQGFDSGVRMLLAVSSP